MKYDNAQFNDAIATFYGRAGNKRRAFQALLVHLEAVYQPFEVSPDCDMITLASGGGVLPLITFCALHDATCCIKITPHGNMHEWRAFFGLEIPGGILLEIAKTIHRNTP